MTRSAGLGLVLLLASGCGREAPEAARRDSAAPPAARPARTVTVRAYFSNPRLAPDPDVDCGVVFPVTRTVPWTDAPARAALEELLAGPTEAEREQGYGTSLNPGVTIRSLAIRDGGAEVDFSAEMERTGGACLVTAIRAQVESTLSQFPGVRSVRIAIEGNTEEILQP